jgi:hypothetical protein
MVNEPIASSLAHFEQEVNRSIHETLGGSPTIRRRIGPSCYRPGGR